MFDFVKTEKIVTFEPAFRLKQIKLAVFHDLIEDWREAKTLPAPLREKLQANCPLDITGDIHISKDNKTVKAVVTLGDGLKIETVLLRHEKRNTICVSSQVGCALGCLFCATGKAGFKRNLLAWEITNQVLFFARYLKKQGEKTGRVVFMGMGEPFLNYDNVIAAIKLLKDKDGFNLGARHFSISTIGVTEGIKKLAQEKLQINLAISLHAPDDKLRESLMPANKEYPLVFLLKEVGEYAKKTRRRVMFEYTMIKGVNDSELQAGELAHLLKNQPLYFVNLISFNPAGVFARLDGFQSSSPAQIKKFKAALEAAGVVVTERYRFGKEIKAACGQLAGR